MVDSSTSELNPTNWRLLPENTENGLMVSDDIYGSSQMIIKEVNWGWGWRWTLEVRQALFQEPTICIADPYISEERFEEIKQDCYIYI